MFSRPGISMLLAAAMLWAGCGDGQSGPADPREGETDKQVREKWGRPLADLPTVKLIVISPHNIDIENEFEWAFSLHHAVAHGAKVDIEWRDVGGGSSAILQYLRNVYENSDRSGIDVVWGGGEYNFQKMADEGIVQPMKLSEDVRRNIPATFGGLEMYDQQHRWCGSAVSGFGFLYNAPLLKQLKREPPAKWDDLSDPRFYNLIALADPTKSGSAAAAYEMIVQSGGNWGDGWAKLLGILGNAKTFYAGASGAAKAPETGETVLAACIDFYGTNRVAKYPDDLVYVSPAGQTAFNPDPIAILKNPPNAELAQRFVDFVLSRRGQALWALRPGEADGPIRSPLGRQPIRKDVYEHYRGKFSTWIINPYDADQAMALDTELWSISYGVLRQLVGAAAIQNRDGLRAAKKKLIETGFDVERLAEFNRLPDNVATRQKLAEIGPLLRDKKQADIIITNWTTFFREKYERVAR